MGEVTKYTIRSCTSDDAATNAAAAGSSSLALTINALADAAGASLNATLQNGSVSVTPVPLPATVLLFLSGLSGLALIRTRHPVIRLSIPGSAA